MTRPVHLAVDARMQAHSGVGVYIRNLLPRLAARAPDWRFSIMGSVFALEQLDWPSGAPVSFLPLSAPIYSLREQWQVPRSLPTHVDALWVPHYNIPVMYRGRLIVTIHDVLHLAHPELAGGFHRRAYSRLLFGAAARRAVRVLTDSEFTRGEFIRFTGADPCDVRGVHLGVSQEWFSVVRRREELEPYVVFVGNVKPHKNVSALVAAFAQIASRLPHRLKIIGRADFWDTPVDLVDRARRGGRVDFMGVVPEKSLRDLVGGADALVLPSLYEGFGLPPLEAMACGCPVMVSRSGSLPEICGDAALYCDATDEASVASQLLRLLTDMALRAELIKRGSARAASFTWDKCADGTLSVLEEAIRGGHILKTNGAPRPSQVTMRRDS